MGDDKHTGSQSPSSVVDTIRKRRRPVANNEFEVDSQLISDKEKSDDDNTAEQGDCGGDSEQFQTATEEDRHNEDDNAKDGQGEEIVASEAMEANIQQIREKMERFTQQSESQIPDNEITVQENGIGDELSIEQIFANKEVPGWRQQITFRGLIVNLMISILLAPDLPAGLGAYQRKDFQLG